MNPHDLRRLNARQPVHFTAGEWLAVVGIAALLALPAGAVFVLLFLL